MPYRIMLFLLSFLLLINLGIIALGLITGVNPYIKYKKEITVGFGILIALFVCVYLILPVIGIM